MRRALRRLLKVLLGLAFIMGAGLIAAPYLLDQHYYHGPKSAHFDGEHFFNPDGEGHVAPIAVPSRAALIWSMMTGRGRAAWPSHIVVAPQKPEARVLGSRLVATWIGHATVLVQTQGLNILTDPNWSETTGPFGIGPRRVAEPGVRFEDLPHIDAVVISHDHYDHLDVPTLQRLQARDHPRIFAGLGVDALLAAHGITAQPVDWTQHFQISPDVEIISTRNHHWGSRWGYDARRSLWSAYVIKTPSGNVFFGGDTWPGDMKWPTEAARYGPIRLALIPIGAFRFAPGQMAIDQHVGPIDAVRVFEGLGAQQAIAIHWGTWQLSTEGYDTPPKMLAEVMKCHGLDPQRFRAVRFGVPMDIAPLQRAAQAPTPADLADCLQRPAITELR
jgi:L-ascorbate metabolism protein UlaG (beta-lactamase superfamily)